MTAEQGTPPRPVTCNHKCQQTHFTIANSWPITKRDRKKSPRSLLDPRTPFLSLRATVSTRAGAHESILLKLLESLSLSHITEQIFKMKC